MDDVDLVQERDERFAPYQIANSKKAEGPAAIGICHYCAEPVPEQHRWCDAECRSDWEYEEKRKVQR